VIAKHTPGPWKVHSNYTVPYGSFNMGRDVGPCGRAVCTVIGEFEKPMPGEEAEANARLIAAAPDLLAALRAFVLNERQLNDEHFAGPQARLMAFARETLAKATGDA